MPMPRIIHYRHKCIGCGLCHEMQPELWRMSKKDGKATLLHAKARKQTFQLEVAEIPPGTREIAEACPVRIIRIT